jgi:hypothetical protein
MSDASSASSVQVVSVPGMSKREEEEKAILALPHAPILDKFVKDLFSKSTSEAISKDDKLRGLHDIILLSLKTLHQAIHKPPEKQQESIDGMWEAWEYLAEGLNAIKEYRQTELMQAMKWPQEFYKQITKAPNSKPFMLFGPEMAEEYLIHVLQQCQIELKDLKAKTEDLRKRGYYN